MKKKTLSIAAALSISLLCQSSASAQEYDQHSTTRVTYGKTYSLKLKASEYSGSPKIFAPMKPRRAYSCVVEVPHSDFTNLAPDSAFSEASLVSLESIDQSFHITPGLSQVYQGQVVSFSQKSISEKVGSEVTPSYLMLILGRAGEATDRLVDVNVTCYHNTLLGSFNTNATPVNVLELRNSSAGSAEASIYVQDPSGNLILDGRKVTLGANQENHILLHEIVGPNRYGSVTVTWIGAPNAIKATVSRYDVSADKLEYKGSQPLEKAED